MVVGPLIVSGGRLRAARLLYWRGFGPRAFWGSGARVRRGGAAGVRAAPSRRRSGLADLRPAVFWCLAPQPRAVASRAFGKLRRRLDGLITPSHLPSACFVVACAGCKAAPESGLQAVLGVFMFVSSSHPSPSERSIVLIDVCNQYDVGALG